ncbi:hypothetical protein EVAR_58534_1 [Eumeta japonica]|uniref:Uncharacterized protein n=1 Tax=Eumeta variegata TaxID=151549 RepID=A0A4C1Z2C1_EUMVA|nr:hypothetical protein EVAR_58534_1 [Eumeta japonica]
MVSSYNIGRDTWQPPCARLPAPAGRGAGRRRVLPPVSAITDMQINEPLADTVFTRYLPAGERKRARTTKTQTAPQTTTSRYLILLLGGVVTSLTSPRTASDFTAPYCFY